MQAFLKAISKKLTFHRLESVRTGDDEQPHRLGLCRGPGYVCDHRSYTVGIIYDQKQIIGASQEIGCVLAKTALAQVQEADLN